MEQPVICVIVPVYKAEATLPRCIESVLTQQLPGGLRLILVDDQSPDRSGEICDAYAAKDPRVMVLHRRERGVSGARNAGLRAATGEYIVFLDSDDALRPGALAAALAAQVETLASKTEGFAVLDETVEEPMKAAIRAAGAEGDSVGGMLETAILGLPAGIGEPYFDSVESEIAHLVFSVPAVKGIEFGTGFGFAGMRGSEANDAFRMTPEGAVVTATNHNAGINGGIANGMPVVFRTVVKPTPSIYKQQDTVDYIAKKDAQLSIQGRHDPCIVPRAAIVQTCAAALAVGDLLTAKYGMAWMEDPTGYRKEVL